MLADSRASLRPDSVLSAAVSCSISGEESVCGVANMGASEARHMTRSIRVVWLFFIVINNFANDKPVLRLVEPCL